jgi:hypothetical protein
VRFAFVVFVFVALLSFPLFAALSFHRGSFFLLEMFKIDCIRSAAEAELMASECTDPEKVRWPFPDSSGSFSFRSASSFVSRCGWRTQASQIRAAVMRAKAYSAEYVLSR